MILEIEVYDQIEVGIEDLINRVRTRFSRYTGSSSYFYGAQS